MKNILEFLFGATALVFLAALFFGKGLSEGRADTEKQAVLHGAAHYVADAKGEPKFTWNDKTP